MPLTPAQTQATTTEYFLGDALGSVRQMANQTGAITYARVYDPYGVVAQTSGASQTAYGFTGEFTSNDIVYLRARHYAPGMGRFLTRDTWEGQYEVPLSLNRWKYVLSNPINFSDPSGHDYQPPQICWWGIDSATGRCKNPPLPPFMSTVVGQPTAGGYDTLVKLGLVACAFTIWLAAQNIDIDNPDSDNNNHVFYYHELGAYSEPGRGTQDIVHDLSVFEWMPGVRGMIRQLQSEDLEVNNMGKNRRMPFLMGRKFESERAIYFFTRNSLTGVNSTATGYDLRVENFDTIKYVQVKWSGGAVSKATLRSFLKQVKSFASGTVLLETTYILSFDKEYLRKNGGEELPFSYP